MTPSQKGSVGLRNARWLSYLTVAAACAVFSVWLLDVARHQWFVTDEWDYLSREGDSLIGWLIRPHNEHTILFTKAWFQVLMATVGARHYVLYMVPLVAAHLVVVASIYRLTWLASASRVVAVGVALSALAMGAGVGTITWAGQFQYVGSVAAGLLAIVLAVEGRGRSLLVTVAVVTIFGALNGTAFIPFGVTAGVVFARRRRWPEATLVSVLPILWLLVAYVVWHPANQYAVEDLQQILRAGPAFAYAILDVAIRQTIGEAHLSATILGALVLGTIALLSPMVFGPRTGRTVPIIGALGLATLMTMFLLIIGRLGRGPELASTGGYSYLFLATLLPVSGILLGHLARSRSSLIAVMGLYVAIGLIGVATIADTAHDLSTWKVGGERLMLTAAAQLTDQVAVFPEQIPVPETAPTVDQGQIRTWTADGQLDAEIAGPAESDQISLNVQWRAAPSTGGLGECRDMTAGQTAEIPRDATVEVLARQLGGAVDLRYPASTALRRFALPAEAITLESLSHRSASLTIVSGDVRLCVGG